MADKVTRIRETLADEVQRLADSDRRSFKNMVELLLEQALALSGPAVVEADVTGSAADMSEPVPPRSEVRRRAAELAGDAHFKPDFGGKIK